jgi:hypothetical protein
VTKTVDDLPDDIAALQAALIAERARAARVEAELAVAKARASDDQALIAHQRLQIEKLTRQIYGQRPLEDESPPRCAGFFCLRGISGEWTLPGTFS